MRPEPLLLLALLLLGGPALGDGLLGRTVLMRGETWDDPAKPLMRSSDYVARVGKGPEFLFLPETSGALVVVAVTIDLGAGRVDLSYEGLPPGAFVKAAFNGYVLSFPVECTLLAGAAIDEAATTLPLDAADVTVEPQAVRIDVAGLSYGPTDRIGIVLDVTDCPIS